MKDIRFLHAADLHLDSAFESLSPEAADERRKGQRQLLFALAEIAEEHGVQAVLLCGDIFDGPEIERETERDFCRAFGSLPCHVLVAPGNHDPYTPHSFWETAHLPDNVYIFKNEEIECVELPGVRTRFWGAGFQNSFSRPLLQDFEAPEKRLGMPDVMLIHGDTGSGESAYNQISRDELLRCGMDYVALGHIHSLSPLKIAGGTAYAYPGCTEGRGFDETGEKGALLVTLSEENGVSAEFVPLPGVRYDIVTADIGAAEPLEAVLGALSGLPAGGACRILLKGECEELPDVNLIRKKLDGRFRELQIRDETTRKINLWEQAGLDTLSGVFIGKLAAMSGAAKSPAERELIELAAHYGLAAIGNGGGLI